MINKKSNYINIKCVENRSADGKPCKESLLAYKGKCQPLGTKTACQGEALGKRLDDGMFDTVECRCSMDLGYVDVNGSCYHEYFRGPCSEGWQIVRTEDGGWKCIEDKCPKGWVQWSGKNCFELETPGGYCEDMYDLKMLRKSPRVFEGENV